MTLSDTTMKFSFSLMGALVGAAAALFVLPAGAKGTSSSVQCPAAAAWATRHNSEQSAAQKHALEAIHPSDSALAAQLGQRYAHDQAAAEALIKKSPNFDKPNPEAWKHLLAVHKANLVWFKPIVDAHGFPTVQQVGPKGVEHAWMLVQHAGSDPAFQDKVLAELKAQLSAEPYLRSNYALLTDRVRIAQRKPQIYGTQFTVKDGHLVMQKTEDVARLDKRRANMDLMPISDYRCTLDQMYHTPPSPTSHHQVQANK